MNSGWKCVLGGFMIHLVLGSLYCWGNITMAVTSYLRLYNSRITYNDTIMVYTAQLACQGLTMFAGGMLEKKVGVKYCILIAGSILVLGTFCATLVTSLIGLIFTYGVPFGVGMGLCYSAPISAAIEWNPSQKGLISGIIVAGFGGGSFIFGQIDMAIVNPKEENVDADTGYFNPNSDVPRRVPLMFFLLGCCYFVLFALGFALITEVGENERQQLEECDLVTGKASRSGDYVPCAGHVEALKELHEQRSHTPPTHVTESVTESVTVSALHTQSMCSNSSSSSSSSSSSVLTPAVASVSASASESISTYFDSLIMNPLIAFHAHLFSDHSMSRHGRQSFSNSKTNRAGTSNTKANATVSGPVFTILGEDDEEEGEEDGGQHSISIELSPMSLLQQLKSNNSTNCINNHGVLSDVQQSEQSQYQSQLPSLSPSPSGVITDTSCSNSSGDVTSRMELCTVIKATMNSNTVVVSSDPTTSFSVAAGSVACLSPASPTSPTSVSNHDSYLYSPHMYTPIEVISLPLTWHIASCFVLTSAGGIFLAGTFKEYGEENIHNEEYLSTIAACSSLFNAAGRIFWGQLADKTSPISTLLILSLTFALVILTYSNIALTMGEFGYGLWTFAVFFCEGGNFSLYLPLLVNIYGSKYCAANYGVVFTIYAAFVVLNMLVLTQIMVISFQTVTLLIGSVTLLGFINIYFLKNHVKSFKRNNVLLTMMTDGTHQDNSSVTNSHPVEV